MKYIGLSVGGQGGEKRRRTDFMLIFLIVF